VGLAVVVLAGAVCVGYVLGGRWTALTGLRLRWWPCVGAAVLAQAGGAAVGLAGAADPRRGYVAGLVLSAAAAAAFCLRNLRVPGVALVALGLAGNAAVVAANGAMPVSAHAARLAHVSLAPVRAGLDPRHEQAGPGTALAALADVVPVRLPVRPEVVSVGDVLVAAGLAHLVVTGMLGAAPAARRRGPAT
jgi:hypothetical protein